MATYKELYDLSRDELLLEKVAMAVAIRASQLKNLPGLDTQQKHWLQTALTAPLAIAKKIIFILLADNKDFTVAQITGASESAIQAVVDDTINKVFL